MVELVRACATTGSDAAWCQFIAYFRQPIALAIIRVARKFGAVQLEFVDDLVQDTFLKLCADRCARLLQFSREHPEAVEAYVKTIAANVAHDFLKAHRSLKRGSGETDQLLENLEPAAKHSDFGGIDAIQQEVLLHEIDRCLDEGLDGNFKSRDRLIFWLHYRQGMSARAIASLSALNLTVKGVESVLLRLTRLVRGKIAAGQTVHEKSSTPEGLGRMNSF